MNKIRTGIILCLIIVIAGGGAILYYRLNTQDYAIEIILPTPSQTITLHITGEINAPGVYDIGQGATAAQAVEMAGGFTSNADQTVANLARTLRDGAQLHIPKAGESTQRININTAPVWLLDALEGIGPSLAERIIVYRSENGRFESIDQLQQVKGIGDAVFAKIEDKITVH